MSLAIVPKSKGDWYQCASQATVIVDDVKMCGTHANLHKQGRAHLAKDCNPAFAPGHAYDSFLKPIKEMADADPQFRAALARALA